MILGEDLRPLREELDRWREAGLTAAFWLRDDDAVADTPALGRLLRLVAEHEAALMLAVIPLRVGPGLAERIAGEPRVVPAAHGVTHENRAPAGQKKEELPAQLGEAVIGRELDRSREVFRAAFGEAGGLWFVPPWNRIAPETAALLPRHGYAGLSVWRGRPTGSPPGLRRLDTHLDLIDWRGGRGGRALADLAREVAALLASRRAVRDTEPFGILAHHLVHDAVADRALAALAALVSGHEAARWLSRDELQVDEARGTPP